MNEIVFNISLVVLSIGFILLVIYITTLLTNKTCPPCAINGNNSNNCLYDNRVNKLIYDDRPSITYLKMFNDPEVGFGKPDFNVEDYSEITSYFTKSNN
jgi:hypothetical protein